MLNQDQAHDAIDHLRGMLLDLTTQLDDLYDRARISGRDGYPTSSGWNRGTSSGEEGHPDPTGRTATDRADHPDSDPTRAQRDRVRHWIAATRRDLEGLIGHNHRTLHPTPENRWNEPECPSCRRAGIWQPVLYRAGHCRRCYDWHHTHNAWPPAPILVAWDRGKRVTSKLLAECGISQPTGRTRTPA